MIAIRIISRLSCFEEAPDRLIAQGAVTRPAYRAV